MSNNMDELFANVKKMVDSGNIPNDIKQMMNNLNNSNSNSSNNNHQNPSINNTDLNNLLNQISPEMIQNFSKILSSQKKENQTQNSQTQQNNVNSNFQNEQTNSAKAQNNDFNFNMDNIDMNTIKNISSIMGNMNNTKNDPRANLLASLKPYLSRLFGEALMRMPETDRRLYLKAYLSRKKEMREDLIFPSLARMPEPKEGVSTGRPRDKVFRRMGFTE